MNKFSKYKKPTAQIILSLLAQASYQQKKMDQILDKASKEVIDKYTQIIEQLAQEGFDFDQKIKLRDHPKLYQIIKNVEREQWQKISDWYGLINYMMEDSLVKSYKDTMTMTYQLFLPDIPKAQDMLNQIQIQITDTYITSKVLPISWLGDGKNYSQRLYSNVANFQKKLDFVLEEGVINGKGLKWMKWAWKELTRSQAYVTSRLLKTETMAMWSMATKESYLNMGIEYVEIIGDAQCGGICNDYVGEVIRLKEAELGDELPPYHPNCCCEYIAFEKEDNFEQTDEDDFEE